MAPPTRGVAVTACKPAESELEAEEEEQEDDPDLGNEVGHF
jgi:hypothetical protein